MTPCAHLGAVWSTTPLPWLQGMATGVRKRVEQRPDSMLEARELPHCELSRLMEQRLLRALENDRAERAAAVSRGGCTARVHVAGLQQRPAQPAAPTWQQSCLHVRVGI